MIAPAFDRIYRAAQKSLQDNLYIMSGEYSIDISGLTESMPEKNESLVAIMAHAVIAKAKA
jgi:hypothetical protein